MSTKEIKQRHFDKVYREAPFIECSCGCGNKIKSKDKYGRDKKFINGHNGRKYEDKTQHKREWNHRNRKKRYEYKKDYDRARKVKLIRLKDSACAHCKTKYDGTNASLFDFHHIENKSFSLSMGTFSRYKWEIVLDELKKCILLCSNCHRIEHFGGW